MFYLISFLFPAFAGVLIGIGKLSDKSRRMYCVVTMLLSDIFGGAAAFFGGEITLFTFAPGVTVTFRADGLGKFFLVLVLVLYTAVLFYAFEYLKMEGREGMFFAFFFISLGALLSATMAANLVTFYLSFEFATLTSMPLVLHEMTKDAIAAARKYLFYSIGGALMGLLGVFYVYFCAGPAKDFAPGGILDPTLAAANRPVLLAVIFVAIVGFGTKAGLYPMHGWLPTAHPIAPAPASSLLSGIIAKAGILAVIRLVYYSVGAEFLRGTWVQLAWSILAMLTIFMGSMMAFQEKVTKKRLAYSTISQLSYIMLGLSLLTEEGLVGGLLHATAHVAAKGCLFLCAGVFIYKLGKKRVDELYGVGRVMPITLWCFLLSALSLIGIPPFAGFVSKWHLASAALFQSNTVLAVLMPTILLISALLTAGYLLPVVVDGFFPEMRHHEEKPHGIPKNTGKSGIRSKSDFKDEKPANTPLKKSEKTAHAMSSEEEAFGAVKGAGSVKAAAGESFAELPEGSKEPSKLMTIPMLALCAVSLFVGIFGGQLAELLSKLLAGAAV
ncbi:MAG: complex I subunit 5 family protein [Lachnospiraceae bacterium]